MGRDAVKGSCVPIDYQRNHRRPQDASATRSGTRFKSSPRAGARYAQPSRPQRPGAAPGSGSMGTIKPAYVRSRHRSRTSPIPVIIAVVAVVAVLSLVGFVVVPAVGNLFSGSAQAEVEPGIEVEVTIPEGASGDTIASILAENDIIPDPKTYYAMVHELEADMLLKPGTYRFETLQDPREVVEQLIAGPNVEGVTLTVAEGLTVKQTAERVEETYGIAADDFINQAKASNYVADYPFLEEAANDSLDGFLFPKTYSFTSTPTADELIRAMLDQYQAETASLDFDGARSAIESRYGVTMSDYDFLILASIIEREALTESQRYNVSSTFYNRMQAGMPLQSDATMMYVTGGAVTADDLRKESPYNTYLNQGLPPTPICAPSLASLKAALEPADTDYYYFFITTDDEYFSETYDQHLQAIEENR